MLSMEPIGFVRSPYRDTQDIPKGLGAKHEAEGTLELRPEFEAGLADIEGFSHLYVIWAFDGSAGFELVGNTPADDRPHGVFATRSPRRPNPIGLTVVELLGRQGPLLRVHGIDMLDGTPILDSAFAAGCLPTGIVFQRHCDAPFEPQSGDGPHTLPATSSPWIKSLEAGRPPKPPAPSS